MEGPVPARICTSGSLFGRGGMASAVIGPHTNLLPSEVRVVAPPIRAGLIFESFSVVAKEALELGARH